MVLWELHLWLWEWQCSRFKSHVDLVKVFSIFCTAGPTDQLPKNRDCLLPNEYD